MKSVQTLDDTYMYTMTLNVGRTGARVDVLQCMDAVHKRRLIDSVKHMSSAQLAGITPHTHTHKM